jgi:hypothetical protein
MGDKRKAYLLLVGMPQRKRLLGRPRRRWLNNNKMVIGDIEWGVMNCIDLAQDRDQ